MARIRSVHPSICSSETMARLPAEVERCFVRLWTHCDDEGRCEDRPIVLAAILFAANEEITSREIEGWLFDLEKAGCIQRYQVDGKKFISVCSWEKWQRPQKPRKSVFPAPPDEKEGSGTVGVPEGYGPVVGVGEGEGVGEVNTYVEQGSTSLVLVHDLPDLPDPVVVVFDEWKKVTGHSKAKLSTDRRRLIKKALSAYSMDEVLDSVRGVANSPFHMGDNEAGTRYDDIQVVLRNAKQIEKFRDMYRTGPVRVKPKSATAIEKLARGEL